MILALWQLGLSVPSINWPSILFYAYLFIVLMFFVGILGFLVWLLIIFKIFNRKVRIYELRNDRFVIREDYGRDVFKKGKHYFQLLKSRKKIPSINYDLITYSAKGRRAVVHLLQLNKESFVAFKPRMTTEQEIIGEIVELLKKRSNIADDDEKEDIDDMVYNRYVLLQTVKGSEGKEDLMEDGKFDTETGQPTKQYSGFTQFNPDRLVKSFAFEVVDLDMKTAHTQQASKIDEYRKQSMLNKFLPIIINVAIFAMATVIIIIMLQKLDGISLALSGAAEGFAQCKAPIAAVNPAIVT